MRKFSFVALSALIFSVNALAIFDPSWERPIYKARLVERTPDGVEIGAGTRKSLTLNQRDGQQKPTSLTFKEERPVYCIKVVGAHCPPFLVDQKEFKVDYSVTDRCNNTTTVARELQNGRVTRSSAVLTLVDYRFNTCDFGPIDPWQVTLQHFRTGVRHFTGRPDGVITPQ